MTTEKKKFRVESDLLGELKVPEEAYYGVQTQRGINNYHISRKQMKDFPMQREWFADQAKRRVSLGLILSEVIKAKQLQAKPEQIKAIVEDAAQSYEHPEEVVRWYYANPQRLAEIEGLALEDNVVEWALSCAKVVDKPIAFDELMGRTAG